jgi:hypothetical protein
MADAAARLTTAVTKTTATLTAEGSLVTLRVQASPLLLQDKRLAGRFFYINIPALSTVRARTA